MANQAINPQQATIDRNRALAMALQAQGMQPLQSPNVRGARTSPWEGVSKIAQSLMAGYQNQQLDQQQAALTGQENAAASARTKALVAALMDPKTDPAKASAIVEALNAGDPAANIGLESILPQAPAPIRNIDPLSPEGIAAQQALRPTPTPRNIDPLSPEGIEAQKALQVLKPEATRNIDPLSPAGIAAQKELQQGKPAPIPGTRAVNTIDANGKPVTRIVPDVAGTEFPDQPTSEQQNRAAALGKIDPILTAISELSEKINTGKGIEAKARGEAEKAKARLNYNDDVAEYEAIISGFTPMVARAVGHTGVLTQQDVDSVRELFPKPGDSKTLRDRKIARVKSILAGNTSPTATSPPASGGVPSVGGTFNGSKVLKVEKVKE